jgi:hypothetical protein
VLGLLFVGAAHSSLYYCVYSAELIVVAAIVRGRRTLRPATLRAFGVAAGLALVGCGPLLGAFLGRTPGPEAARIDTGFDLFSGDLLGFFVPAFTHPWFGSPLTALHRRVTAIGCLPHESTTYVGWIVLGLALFGAAGRLRAGKPVALLLAVAGVFSVLALGSHLRVYGVPTGIPLPGLLLEQLPVLRLARAPGRYFVVAMLGFALLAALGWQQLRPAWLRWPLLALLALDYAAFPLPSMSTDVGPAYRRLAEVPGDFAVLDVPVHVRDGYMAFGRRDSTPIFAQTLHQHRIVSGAVSRLPSWKWRAVLNAPVLGTLMLPEPPDPARLQRDRREGPAFFSDWAIDAIVLDASMSGSTREDYLEEVLPIRSRERFADGSQILWLKAR